MPGPPRVRLSGAGAYQGMPLLLGATRRARPPVSQELPEKILAALKAYGFTELTPVFRQQYAENPFVHVLTDGLVEASEELARLRAALMKEE